jgi:hypothetical protein
MSTIQTTQAALFGREYAQDAARESLDDIKRNAKDADKVTKIALGISMPHQAAFILSLVPIAFPVTGDLKHAIIAWIESIVAIAASFAIPVAVDYLILICIRNLAQRAASRVAKLTAFWVMLVPITLSATVNMLAPSPWLVRSLFGAIVVLIPLSQAVRVTGARPDFRKLGTMELDVRAEIAAVEPVTEVVAPEPTSPVADARARAAEARRLVASNPNLRVAEIASLTGVSRSTARQIINARRLVTEVDEVLDSAAPVSPAVQA